MIPNYFTEIYKHNLPWSYHWHQHCYARIDRKVPMGQNMLVIRCKRQTGSYSHFHYYQSYESHHNFSIHLGTWPCRNAWEALHLKNKFVAVEVRSLYIIGVQFLLRWIRKASVQNYKVFLDKTDLNILTVYWTEIFFAD